MGPRDVKALGQLGNHLGYHGLKAGINRKELNVYPAFPELPMWLQW